MARTGQAYALSLVCLLGLLNGAFAQPNDREKVTVAFTKQGLAGADIRDARAAVAMWSERLFKEFVPHLRTEPVVADFQDTDGVVKLVAERNVAALGMHGLDYLALRKRLALEPILSVIYECSQTVPFLLVVNKQKAASGLEGLEAGQVIIDRSAAGTVPWLWLDTVLLRDVGMAARTFFTDIRYVNRTTAALLPVFFGQVTACVVSRPSYETMVELNPQVAKRLTIIAESPPLLLGIVCVRTDLRPDLKRDLKKMFLSVNDSPLLEQVSLLFRIERLTPYEPSFLTTLEALAHEHEQLLRRTSREGVTR